MTASISWQMAKFTRPHTPSGWIRAECLKKSWTQNPRTAEVERLLKKISQEVGKQRYENVRGLLARLADHLGENDPEVNRIATLLDFMEGEE